MVSEFHRLQGCGCSRWNRRSERRFTTITARGLCFLGEKLSIVATDRRSRSLSTLRQARARVPARQGRVLAPRPLGSFGEGYECLNRFAVARHLHLDLVTRF